MVVGVNGTLGSSNFGFLPLGAKKPSSVRLDMAVVQMEKSVRQRGGLSGLIGQPTACLEQEGNQVTKKLQAIGRSLFGKRDTGACTKTQKGCCNKEKGDAVAEDPLLNPAVLTESSITGTTFILNDFECIGIT